MFANLSRLFRYRGLIQALVARELKARYRGSVLGFLWSFINPLLLLSIYTFVFTVIIPNRSEILRPFGPIACVVGARPNYMKIAPLLREV